VVVLIGAAGIAYASIPDGSGVIHGCVAKKDGSLRVIDTGAGGSCSAAKETALNWSSGVGGPSGGNPNVWTVDGGQADITGALQGITGVSLPAGTYLVMAKGNAVPDGPGQSIQGSCLLVTVGATAEITQVDGSIVEVLWPMTTTGTGAGDMPVSTFAIITLAGASDVGLACAAFAGSTFTMTEVTVTAVAVGQINPPA